MHQLSSMINDKKVIACCGETSLANAKQSLVTMMQVRLLLALLQGSWPQCWPPLNLPPPPVQVYEYFISHHLAKSFESLFGSVTCLPGCFTLYRIRTPDTHKPLFISDQIILDYSENRVDTLQYVHP
jgi:chitin synthase